jgi:hypothetical protein
MLFFIVLAVHAYTAEELDKARACSKILIDLFANDMAVVKKITDQKPHLPSSALEEKIFSDALDYCRLNAPMSVLRPVRYFMGDQKWTDFKKYVKFFPEKYNTEKDLKVSEDHLKLRQEVLDTEGGLHYVGKPEHEEQAMKEYKKRMAEQGNDQSAPKPQPQAQRNPNDPNVRRLEILEQRMRERGMNPATDL